MINVKTTLNFEVMADRFKVYTHTHTHTNVLIYKIMLFLLSEVELNMCETEK